MSNEVFIIRPSVKKDYYEVAKFGDEKRVTDSKDSISVSLVKYSKTYMHCDCLGFRHHRNTPEIHKHCRLVKYWVEELKKEIGVALWFENDLIYYNKFLDLDFIESKYYK